MQKSKTADDLNEIISNQLDILSKAKVTDEELMRAKAISTFIGKQLKLDGLRQNYFDYRQRGGPAIDSMESPKNPPNVAIRKKTP